MKSSLSEADRHVESNIQLYMPMDRGIHSTYLPRAGILPILRIGYMTSKKQIIKR